MKFLLTPELGRLARWLRATGYDAAVFEGETPDLLARATFEKRILLTRRTGLRHHRGTPVVTLLSDHIREQLKEVSRSCRLRSLQKHLFTRCLLCNVPVEPIAKEKIKRRTPPYVFKTQKDFSHCPKCGRVYWAATHWERASNFLAVLTRKEGSPR